MSADILRNHTPAHAMIGLRFKTKRLLSCENPPCFVQCGKAKGVYETQISVGYAGCRVGLSIGCRIWGWFSFRYCSL